MNRSGETISGREKLARLVPGTVYERRDQLVAQLVMIVSSQEGLDDDGEDRVTLLWPSNRTRWTLAQRSMSWWVDEWSIAAKDGETRR